MKQAGDVRSGLNYNRFTYESDEAARPTQIADTLSPLTARPLEIASSRCRLEIWKRHLPAYDELFARAPRPCNGTFDIHDDTTIAINLRDGLQPLAIDMGIKKMMVRFSWPAITSAERCIIMTQKARLLAVEKCKT